MDPNEKKKLIDLWDDYDENHPANGYLRGDADFNGPVRKRKCTDLLFLILFVGLNIGMGYVSYTVINDGTPIRLSRGYDFRAAVCGQGGLKNIPYMYWPDPNVIDFALCIESCPKYYITNYYCVYEQDHVTLLSDWCWDTIQSTTLGYYCLPIFNQQRRKVLQYLYGTMQLLKRSLGDLILAWDTILAGIVVSLCVSFTYLMFFRFQCNLYLDASVGLMSLSIVANQVLLLFFVYLFYKAYQISYNLLCNGNGGLNPEYCYTNPSDVLLYILFGIGFITVLYPLVILLKLKSIRLSIGIIKLGTMPFYTLKQIFFYPLLQLVIGCGLLTFAMVVILYTMSTGVISLIVNPDIPGGRSKIIEYTSNEKYYMIYNVLMSLWWMSFLIAFSEFVLSAAVSVWYFTRERSSLYFPLWRGLKLILRYHMGSVVRGSLFNVLTVVPKFILETYKSLALICRYSSPKCTDCMLRSCCCLKCNQKWLRYFTKYSYIFIAIFGESYYESARKSFYLINRNRERMFVPAVAGDFGMLIIKLTITLSGSSLAFSLVTLSTNTPLGHPTSQLVAPVFIWLISFIVCFYVGQIFGGSMQACMNTIIICGACDEEMFTREQRYMYKELIEYLDKIYEEMTEQQREHKEMVKMKASKKVYQKTKIADEAEPTSVMRSLFNKNDTEAAAPVIALNVDDLDDEDNVFAAAKPNIVVNRAFEPDNSFNAGNYNEFGSSFRNQNNSYMRVRENSPSNSRLNPDTNLNPANRSTVSNNTSINSFTVARSYNNSSAMSQRSGFPANKPEDSRAVSRDNIPKGTFLNRPVAQDPESRLLSANKSPTVPSYKPTPDSAENNAEEDPIQVFSEKSLEVEPNDDYRPKFSR
jgi:Plasma-membrane choline transporter